MTGALTIQVVGPGLSVQDLGRPGHMATGLSRGGAADRLALFEAAALLGLPAVVGAVEMAGQGGRFQTSEPTRFALTGAPMTATLDGAPLSWAASHLLLPGQTLTISGARAGFYGYLTPAGGVAGPRFLGSVAAHLAVGIGGLLKAGDRIAIGPDPDPSAPSQRLIVPDRFSGGDIRFMPGPQTDLFSPETLTRFQETDFTRSPKGNRQGVRLDHAAAPFAAEIQGLASDLVRPGDLQVTGEGVPYGLLCECQTTGGYGRIGTVIDADLPRLAQAAPGARLRFRLLSLDEADALYQPETEILAKLCQAAQPLTRNPHDIPDLLSYQLISGVVAGNEE
ncbi:MAG TPA: urea amidolyase [Aliiroseovarius sp.]|nr:urea amidolyase [Aliiroseovarius sp.]